MLGVWLYVMEAHSHAFWFLAVCARRLALLGPRVPVGQFLGHRLIKRGSLILAVFILACPPLWAIPSAEHIWYNRHETDGHQQINQVHASLKPTLFLWDWPDWCFVFSCLSHFSDPLSIRLRPSSDIRYPLCSYCDSIFLNR